MFKEKSWRFVNSASPIWFQQFLNKNIAAAVSLLFNYPIHICMHVSNERKYLASIKDIWFDKLKPMTASIFISKSQKYFYTLTTAVLIPLNYYLASNVLNFKYYQSIRQLGSNDLYKILLVEQKFNNIFTSFTCLVLNIQTSFSLCFCH